MLQDIACGRKVSLSHAECALLGRHASEVGLVGAVGTTEGARVTVPHGHALHYTADHALGALKGRHVLDIEEEADE
eukprot:422637-Hanusia_phi.AAC.3